MLGNFIVIFIAIFPNKRVKKIKSIIQASKYIYQQKKSFIESEMCPSPQNIHSTELNEM